MEAATGLALEDLPPGYDDAAERGYSPLHAACEVTLFKRQPHLAWACIHISTIIKTTVPDLSVYLSGLKPSKKKGAIAAATVAKTRTRSNKLTGSR